MPSFFYFLFFKFFFGGAGGKLSNCWAFVNKDIAYLVNGFHVIGNLCMPERILLVMDVDDV